MAKSSKPMVRIHNSETNEIIDREMTNEEFACYQETLAAQEAKKIEAETKATAKQSILDRIGLTADELKTILG
jgi:hypothetical protein